jgi:hypothetical protein
VLVFKKDTLLLMHYYVVLFKGNAGWQTVGTLILFPGGQGWAFWHMQDLIERWSRPIFEQHRERREEEELRERELQMKQARAARQAQAQAAADDSEAARKVCLPNSPCAVPYLYGYDDS